MIYVISAMARRFVLDSETVTAAPLEFLSTLMKVG